MYEWNYAPLVCFCAKMRVFLLCDVVDFKMNEEPISRLNIQQAWILFWSMLEYFQTYSIDLYKIKYYVHQKLWLSHKDWVKYFLLAHKYSFRGIPFSRFGILYFYQYHILCANKSLFSFRQKNPVYESFDLGQKDADKIWKGISCEIPTKIDYIIFRFMTWSFYFLSS